MAYMDNQAQRIRKLRKDLKLTQQQLADICGVKRPAVSHWEADPRVRITGQNLDKLCTALGVTASYILSGKSEARVMEQQSLYVSVSSAPASRGMCPEVSWVQAGQWAEVCELPVDAETTSWYPRPPGASEQTFVLRVVGESMMPEYPPGRLIYVDPEVCPQSGDDVIAVLTETNEATFKRLLHEPGAASMLKALNPAWQNPYLPINGNCQIIGVVVADMRMRQR